MLLGSRINLLPSMGHARVNTALWRDGTVRRRSVDLRGQTLLWRRAFAPAPW
jgi:hypothetical protein